ncbi:hypothetical protein GUJ93_ZPchr0006g42661 [Zizania palustris]|uniref:Uncharacterized protein n=1 Tax=Zizania palustris TaxID=103762 RepID=A0A8J5SYR3_ZIZPA|nr:hypothetical protein GUJ93_ZPchr0006g42661 [Zizania palustris]
MEGFQANLQRGTEDSGEAWARTRLLEVWSPEVRVRPETVYAPDREPGILSPLASNLEARGKTSGARRLSEGDPEDGCIESPKGACRAYQGEASSAEIGAHHL